MIKNNNILKTNMFPYGMPETTTAEYPATTPGNPASTGFTTTTTDLIQDPIVPSTLQMGTPISQTGLQYTLPSTDVQYGESLTTTSAYPATNYEYTNEAVTTTSAYPATNYEYTNEAVTTTSAYPATNYVLLQLLLRFLLQIMNMQVLPQPLIIKFQLLRQLIVLVIKLLLLLFNINK